MNMSDPPSFLTKDTKDYADDMGVPVSQLVWLARHAAENYTSFEKPKRKGGMRVLYNPSAPLRQAQSWLLANVLDPINVSEWAMAYERGKSTLDAVKPHAMSLALVKIDLSDHYGHIKAMDVFHVFRSCGVAYSPSLIFADLCTVDGSLAQGAITSPRISNLFMRSFDREASELCRSMDAHYTRYADDILISTKYTLGKGVYERLLKNVDDIAARYGQELNAGKCRYMTGPERKSALGLHIADTVTMFRAARKNFRALCYHIENDIPAGTKVYRDALASARGMWQYMRQVDPQHAEMFLEKHQWLEK